jgi:HEAT repeat protein
MKPKLILCLALVLSGGLFGCVTKPNEPLYQGKPLDDYLDGFAKGNEEDLPISIEAVRHMGTNAIPRLHRLLHSRDYFLKNTAKRILVKIRWLKFRARPEAWFVRKEAAIACQVLATNAEPLTPDLIDLLGDEAAGSDASYALALIGPAAVPALTNALASPDIRIQDNAIESLRNMSASYTNNAVIINAFITLLRSSNVDIRCMSADCVGKIRKEPGIVIPALIENLTDTNTNVREWAGGAIISYGDQVKPFVPALLNDLNGTNQYAQYEAAIIIKRIDPETAVKAGLKFDTN